MVNLIDYLIAKYFPASSRQQVTGVSGLVSYPNPFQDALTVDYQLLQPQTVLIRLLNLAGQEVANLFSGQQGSGFTAVGLASRSGNPARHLSAGFGHGQGKSHSQIGLVEMIRTWCWFANMLGCQVKLPVIAGRACLRPGTERQRMH